MEVPFPILILDDDPDALENARYVLSSCKVDVESSPEAALKKIAQNNYAVILSDYQMSKMNGVEFLKKVFEISPRARRVLVSAFVDLVDTEALWNQARAHRILAKPYKPEELREVVESSVLEYVIEAENERLRTLALMDSVTGVANQRHFWDRFRAEISRSGRFKRPLALILFDLDDFKKINDEKGHLEGDNALKLVADSLVKQCRQMDIVARYGGDEFALVLPEIDADNVLNIAKRVRDKVQEETGHSMSGGVALFPELKTEKELLAAADKVLLRVKKNSKGNVEL